MSEPIKIIISGLDGAGKTSILTSLDKKYDFQQDIQSLTPTIRVDYHRTVFLGNLVTFFDMGGQTQYRELYKKREDMYFAGTDLLIYVIDCQDKGRFTESMDFLRIILDYFEENKMDVPLIVSFHKYDPELRADVQLNDDINNLREEILENYPSIKALFQATSIFDIISIVQLISYALSIFDESFFDLSALLEAYLEEFDAAALILFDKNGIIISEFYSDHIKPDYYIELLETIKEHLFLLKRMQEEDFKGDYEFFEEEGALLSYLHRLEGYGDETFYISVLIEGEEKHRDTILEKFADFLADLDLILKGIV